MFLFNNHSPYPSHRRPLRSTSQQHEGLRPPSARWLPPVKHKNELFQWPNRTALPLNISVSKVIYTGWYWGLFQFPASSHQVWITFPDRMLSHIVWLLSGFISKGHQLHIKMWFPELFEVISAGLIHLNAVSAPAYKSGQHFLGCLKHLHNKSPHRRSVSAKQAPFQKLIRDLSSHDVNI